MLELSQKETMLAAQKVQADSSLNELVTKEEEFFLTQPKLSIVTKTSYDEGLMA